MRRLAAVLAMALLIGACTTGAREAQPYEGVWESVGFGFYLVIDNGFVEVYEHTRVGCIRVSSGPARGISDVVTLESNGSLVLQERGRIIEFQDLGVLPGRCLDGLDPTDTLAVVAATIEEHHPSWSERDTGWAARRDGIVDGTGEDPAATLAAIRDLLDPLADPQVRLVVGDGTVLSGRTWSPGSVPEAALQLEEWLAGGVAGLTAEEDGALFWGSREDDVGYIAIARLGGLADDVEVDERRFATALDRALAALDGPRGLVVDLRMLRDGSESMALLVASRFIEQETVIGTRAVRIGATDAYTDPLPIVVRPLPIGTYSGRLAVIVGPGTAGPGELLGLAFSSANNVTIVGEATAGSPSPILVRSLPNGWNLGVPHQRVWDTKGRLVESAGITVDEVVAAGSDGEDPQLARAVTIAGG
jgi:hypothetical protein